MKMMNEFRTKNMAWETIHKKKFSVFHIKYNK